jgi:hypothetical protein
MSRRRRWRFSAKQKRGQAFENKQSGEMADFAPMNDLKGLRLRRETLHFALRNDPPLISLAFLPVEVQNETLAKSTAASGSRGGSCATLCDSALGNGAASL